MTTLIFVHGACVRDADWWWSQMTQPLGKLGVPSVAVALPSCGESGDTLGDLYDDVHACRQAIARVDGPVVLCGHSYGGCVITGVADRLPDRIGALVYLDAFVPENGKALIDYLRSL